VLDRNKEVKSIGVVVVTFNSGQYLVDCLRSLKDSLEGVDIDLQIAVVDNHPKLLDKDLIPENVHYIQNPLNTGFGSGCNLGFYFLEENCDPDFFMLINPDAYVAEDFFYQLDEFLNLNSNLQVPISPLISFPEKVYSGIAKDLLVIKSKSVKIKDDLHLIRIFDPAGNCVSGTELESKTVSKDDVIVFDSSNTDLLKVDKGSPWFKNYAKFDFSQLNPDYLIQNAGSFINENLDGGDLQTYWLRSRFPSTPSQRLVWCGAAVVLPKSYLTTVGLFDEQYFLYYEDTDFALRGSKFGLYPVLNPMLNVYHHHSKSTNQVPQQRSKQIWIGRSYFVSKNFGVLAAWMLFGARVLSNCKMLVRRRTTLKHFVKYIFPELLYSLVGLFKAFTKRKVGAFNEV
jgi:GT2 family glycosyltransferase